MPPPAAWQLTGGRLLQLLQARMRMVRTEQRMALIGKVKTQRHSLLVALSQQ